MSAYLVLLRVEVTAFHPQDPVARELRLVSVALFLAFGEACAPPYNVRALPVTLLCGARTFLSPIHTGQRPSGQLRGGFYACGRRSRVISNAFAKIAKSGSALALLAGTTYRKTLASS